MKTTNDVTETRIHWASECDRTAFWAVREELRGELTPDRVQVLGLALLAAVERCEAGEWIHTEEA